MRFSTIGQWLIILLPFAAIILFMVNYMGIGIPFLGGHATAEPAAGSMGEGGLIQEPLEQPRAFHRTLDSWQYMMTARYHYTIMGKIVGTREYPESGPDQITPVDLAVACGDVIRPAYFPYFTFSMEDRQLSTTVSYPKFVTMLPDEYWFSHIANNHLVFADPEIPVAVRQAVVGDCVKIRGYLVDIRGQGPHGETYTRTTSISRTDEYPAGCEVVYVESFETIPC